MALSSSGKREFRLIDLLVVAAIVCVLVSLFLPFLSRTRERSGSRYQCEMNLHQIGLAIHNYAAIYNTALPPLCGVPPGAAWADGKGNTYPQSFFFTLLPLVEQQAMYEAGMNPATNGRTWNGRINNNTDTGPIYDHGVVRLYTCPLDPTSSRDHTTPSDWVGASYAANYQVFGTENGSPKYNLGNIPDGTSNIVFITERFHYFPGPDGQFTDPTGASRQAANLWAWPVNCGTTPPSPYGTPVPQYAAMFAYGNVSDAPAFGYGPVVFSAPQVGISPGEADFRLVQSGHRSVDAVVLVILGDGSCRGVGAGVSQPTWQSALLPADGVPLGPDW
jgi:hypothetical protein